MRKPIVAGQFYESSRERLIKQIEGCFLSPFGPGKLPDLKQDPGTRKNIKAIISPHAGYTYSGMCAAHGFQAIYESHFPDIFIILALSHQGYPSSISLEDWETPLGIVKNDIQFSTLLLKNSSLKHDELAHRFEHSLEVQLPFLQYIYQKEKEKLSKLKICPIMIGHQEDYAKIGEDIKALIKETRKKAIIIASSDFTHYGQNFDYIPFENDNKKDLKKNIYNLDKKAINFILKGDNKGFIRYIDETGATICGQYPIAALLNSINFKKAKLLKYYTSGDILGDYSSSVSYASIAFY